MIELQRVNIKEISKIEPALTGGHRLCAGCGAGTMARQVTLAAQALGEPFMIVNATGCLEVATTIYPYNSWTVPWLHNAFENAAATASGTIVALEALRRKKQLEYDHIHMLVFGGDGGTYDIGLQSLSGAIERGHDFLYVCYNNGAYMNCLSLDTYIMTEDGLKRVIDIQLGDLVYAFDQTTGDLVLKECSGIYDNGIKEVYKLKTLHHSIKTTLNHPFLTVQRSRKKDESALIWKTLEQLELGDEIVVLKKEPNIDKNLSQTKQRNLLAENKYFSSEKIVSIEFIKEEPTIDLRVEDEHNFIAEGIVVHNTGIQRSSGTPMCASTTTSPAGTVIPGKIKWAKPLPEIMAAHGIPTFTASPFYHRDLMSKVQAGLKHDGPVFILVDSPCNLGQRYEPNISLEVTKLAVQTCFFPLYTTYQDEWELTSESSRIANNPDRKVPVVDYLKIQGRFKHLFKPEWKDKLVEIQETIDDRWERLIKKTKY